MKINTNVIWIGIFSTMITLGSITDEAIILLGDENSLILMLVSMIITACCGLSTIVMICR